MIKIIIFVYLFSILTVNAENTVIFEPKTKIVKIPSVSVGGVETYTNIELLLRDDGLFELINFNSAPTHTHTTTPSQISSCPSQDMSIDTSSYDLYSHNVKYGIGNDGVNFTTDDAILIEHASVPDAVKFDEDDAYIYYVNGIPGQHAIYVSKFNFSTQSAEQVGCININGVINEGAVDPDILITDDGKFKLYYYGNFRNPNETHRFYRSESTDGINFVNETLIHESETGTDPSLIILADGSYRMAYACSGKICLAKSEDGNDFSDYASLDISAIPELSLTNNQSIRLYASSSSYISNDGGMSWIIEAEKNTTASNNVKTNYADPSFLEHNDEYYLFYKVF